MKPFVQRVTFASLMLLAVPVFAAERGGDPVAGAEKAQSCLACHSADAVESNPEWPRLRGQHVDYIIQALRAYQSGDRENPIMSGQVQGLSRQDMRDIAAWFASQNGELYTPAKP